jgi:hypothetical protein
MELCLPPRAKGKVIGTLTIDIGIISQFESVHNAMIRVHFPQSKKEGVMLRPKNQVRNDLTNKTEYKIRGTHKAFLDYLQKS